MTRRFVQFETRLRQIMRGAKDDFEELALELFRLQYESNQPYRNYCIALGRGPANVGRWPEIPAIPTAAFQDFDVTCFPERQRTTVFHSSGTAGERPSRHFHNAESLDIYGASVLSWFQKHVALLQTQMIFLTPAAHTVPHSSLAHMFDALGRRSGNPGSGFVGRIDSSGGWLVPVDSAIHALSEAQTATQPVGILGTAFNFVHLLEALGQRQIRFTLPTGSWALETGGYKGRSRALLKTDLHALISSSFAISPDRIISEYGMCELSSQAYDMTLLNVSQHSDATDDGKGSRVFRFPPWARTQIISPETGRAVADGEVGLLRVFDLANVYSVMAIETQDLAVRRSRGFELVGRAAGAERRGCSLMAV
ncbi:MAG: hypothetical protein L0Y58_08310 [Verrucomicrobia subdivision 3 bacterium]|nr:hypothetical protein [Limisphaerales bacterium]